MFYEQSLSRIEVAIKDRFPDSMAQEGISSATIPHHLLWMINQIKRFDTKSVADATKAARWIGWMYCVCELVLNLWSNDTSRDIAREDVSLGNHLPH